jgi:hypothetical protein
MRQNVARKPRLNLPQLPFRNADGSKVLELWVQRSLFDAKNLVGIFDFSPDPVSQVAIADAREMGEMAEGKDGRQRWIDSDHRLTGCDGRIQNGLRNTKLLGFTNVGLRLPIFHLL